MKYACRLSKLIQNSSSYWCRPKCLWYPLARSNMFTFSQKIIPFKKFEKRAIKTDDRTFTFIQCIIYTQFVFIAEWPIFEINERKLN